MNATILPFNGINRQWVHNSLCEIQIVGSERPYDFSKHKILCSTQINGTNLFLLENICIQRERKKSNWYRKNDKQTDDKNKVNQWYKIFAYMTTATTTLLWKKKCKIPINKWYTHQNRTTTIEARMQKGPKHAYIKKNYKIIETIIQNKNVGLACVFTENMCLCSVPFAVCHCGSFYGNIWLLCFILFLNSFIHLFIQAFALQNFCILFFLHLILFHGLVCGFVLLSPTLFFFL